MENDNGLDLSLSLPYVGPSTSFKGNNGSGSETRVEEADRGSKLIDDFKNFLDGGSQKDDFVDGSQRNNQSRPEENLFYDLSKAAANVDTSSSINTGGFWGKNDNRSTDVQDIRQEASGKRKNLFDETNCQKRHERDDHVADLHDKTRTPHISITTDEGSTAENEDVADSEADGSTSKLVQHHDSASKINTRNGGLSEGAKEVHVVSDSSGVRFPILSEKEYRAGNVTYGMRLSDYSPSSMAQVIAPASNERSGTQQAVVPANLPLLFGYSSLQMPTAEPGNSQALVSHPVQFHSPYFGRGPPNSNKQSDGMKIAQATMPVNALKPFEKVKGDTAHASEEGSSSHPEGDGTTNAKNPTDQAWPEGCPPEHPIIHFGIAADLKFGGSGSSPNLPWVSTTGPGPNSKTISGVSYRYNGTQIRIVCACHGSHMSPEEFAQHASEEQPNPNSSGGTAVVAASSVPNNKPAASAQS